MKYAVALCFVFRLTAQDESSELNVNARYTVESIDFSRQRDYRLSNSLLEEIHNFIGQKLNSERLGRLAARISTELHAHQVSFRVARGNAPEHVRVVLDVDDRRGNFDFSIPRVVYSSRLGVSGAGEATLTAGANALTFGVLSDGETLVERSTGFRARYERLTFGENQRVRLGFEFDAFHEQYDRSTLAALGGATGSSLGAAAYRSRRNVEPSATFVLAGPLTLTVGASFQQLDSVSANAVNAGLRFHRHWQVTDSISQDLDAGYSLRASSKLLGSDLAYTKHAVRAKYKFGFGPNHKAEAAVMVGSVSGRAPLFERFVLGNSSTLRGWDKYELDPLGGNRVAHASVTYGYRVFRVFYDAGAVWNKGEPAEMKQSVGAGVSSGLGLFSRDAFLFALAFPIRQGHMEPMLIAGMNF